jgi:hypothetical protein
MFRAARNLGATIRAAFDAQRNKYALLNSFFAKQFRASDHVGKLHGIVPLISNARDILA